MKNWYQLPAREVLAEFDVTPQGLSGEQVKSQFVKFGFNELPKARRASGLSLFFKQFCNPLIYILLLAALSTYLLKHFIDTWVILGVVIFNSLIGFLQEHKAEDALQALKQMLTPKAKVIRGGIILDVLARQIVPGDIMVLESGMKISADARVVEADDLRVDESILTGESSPVDKKSNTLSSSCQICDRSNMVYTGTTISSGRGIAVAVSTGAQTELGKIAQEVQAVSQTQTPLQERLARFGHLIIYIVLSACFLIFLSGLVRGFTLSEIFLVSISMAVSAIPEGLPVVITITLAVGVSRMARQKAIIRQLEAVETLGSVSLICSDKTGTLTHNQMTVQKINIPGKLYDITGEGYEITGKFIERGKSILPNKNPHLGKLIQLGVLCNNSSLICDKSRWRVHGDPTEGALLTLAAKADLKISELNKRFARLDEIPFSSELNLMATLHRTPYRNKNLVAVKGSLETILKLSKYFWQGDRSRPFSGQRKKAIIGQSHWLAGEGLRILALATREISANCHKIELKDVSRLSFVGFVGMMDPPRQEAQKAVKLAASAGITTVMVTGDHKLTAFSIAKKLGIAENITQAISGEEMLAKNHWEELEKYRVFARVAPDLKLKIVKFFQRKNYVVAVTGDGVNDAPALKAADVGIAMGGAGTDVAREAAEMVLVDDNFATIIRAIEEGRTVIRNIRRVVLYLLSTNAGELLTLFAATLIGWPLPLLAVQILWINLVTDGTAHIALALEPKHADVMDYPPRPRHENILSRVMVLRIIILAVVIASGTLTLYWLALTRGASGEQARTIAFVTLAMFQIINVFNCRSLKFSIFTTRFFTNPYVFLSIAASILLTVATAHSFILQKFFHTVPLSWAEWAIIIPVSLSIIVVVEIEKLIRMKINTKY